MKQIFSGTLTQQKETKGTVVYNSPKFGTIYVPKLLLPDGDAPETIDVTISTK